MIRAAGILIVDKNGNALFTQRAPGGDHVGEWCVPGGKIEEGETALQAAIREVKEECGFSCAPQGCKEYMRRVKDGVDFTTFICKIQESFIVAPGEEVSAFAWAPLELPPRPLHPGCEVLVNLHKMNELELARAMVAQEIAGPIKYENVWLVDMRVTGTGLAYRHKFEEFAWRDPSLYLNPDFLARCNGLPVILEHPKSNTLNTKEYNDRNVGSIFLPYLREFEQEVWAIVKIWDEPTANLVKNNQLSTSPAVVWRENAGNVVAELNSGEKVFIEGKPNLLDHLAICEQGVWDKGGEPRGISTTAIGDSAMPEEVKKDEKVAADSAADQNQKNFEALMAKLSGVADSVSTLTTRMDSVESRIDAVTPKNRVLTDAEKKEAADKEAADKAAADAKAAADKEAADKEAADKAAADKAAADKAAGDAFPPKKEEEKEEKKAADGTTAADSVSKKDFDAIVEANKTLMARLDGVEGKLPKPLTDADFDAFAQVQSRADAVLSMFGKSAGRPMHGETVLAYRRRLLTPLKEHDPQWKGVDLRVLSVADEVAFGVAEASILKSAADAARNPASVPTGTLREHVESRGGHTYTRFYGRPAAWMNGFAPRGRRVTRINQPNKGQLGA